MKTRWVLVLLCLVLLSSCKAEVSDVGYLCMGVQKSLTSDTDSVLSYFEYRATALFELKDTPIQGETELRQVGAMDGVSDRVGPFTQGLWEIEIHACNRAGIVLYTDTKQVYITRGRTSYIVFDAHRAEGLGTVEVDVTVPRTGTDPILSAVFDSGAVKRTITDWTVETTEDSYRFTGSFNMDSGSYTATFTVPGGGESVAIEVLAGQTGHIRGSVYPSRHADGSLVVDQPEETRTHIAGAKDIKLGTSLSLSLVFDKGSSKDSTWYVNGDVVGKGLTYTFTPTKSGLYEIVCVTYRENGYEESISSCATVRVLP